MTSTSAQTTVVTHWTVSHGLSGYLPMSDDTAAWLSWSDARDENGEPDYGDDIPTMRATVNSMVADGDVAPIDGVEWTGWVADSDGRTIYFSLSAHPSSECDDMCEVIDSDS